MLRWREREKKNGGKWRRKIKRVQGDANCKGGKVRGRRGKVRGRRRKNRNERGEERKRHEGEGGEVFTHPQGRPSR